MCCTRGAAHWIWIWRQRFCGSFDRVILGTAWQARALTIGCSHTSILTSAQNWFCAPRRRDSPPTDDNPTDPHSLDSTPRCRIILSPYSQNGRRRWCSDVCCCTPAATTTNALANDSTVPRGESSSLVRSQFRSLVDCFCRMEEMARWRAQGIRLLGAPVCARGVGIIDTLIGGWAIDADKQRYRWCLLRRAERVLPARDRKSVV